MVRTFAIFPGVLGSIPSMNQYIFKTPISPSHPTLHMLRGDSHKPYKGALIGKFYLLISNMLMLKTLQHIKNIILILGILDNLVSKNQKNVPTSFMDDP